MIPQAPRLPVMYIMPKVHKSIDHPPGRPIISGIDSLYSRVGEYVDIYLKPLVTQGKSYLKGSRELICYKKIEVTANTILVTVDIESLYTDIKVTV